VVARTVLSRVPRLLVPVGAMVSRGPTVPLGADSVIVDRVADDLSERLGVVRSPVVPFGVHARSDPETPGSASLTRKTLHRLMNELIAAWETEAKIREFVFLTTHSADAHLEALSTIRSTCSVRLIDLFQGLESTPPDTRPIEIPLLAWLTPALVPNATAAEHADGERIYQAILARLVSQLESWSH
jgi:creatinine amidohydrolase/Fe(II)-dependent formamide hydrolase-like protein